MAKSGHLPGIPASQSQSTLGHFGRGKSCKHENEFAAETAVLPVGGFVKRRLLHNKLSSKPWDELVCSEKSAAFGE